MILSENELGVKMIERQRRHGALRIWFLDEPPIRPLVALVSVIAVLLALPRAAAAAIVRPEPVILVVLAAIVIVGLLGLRSGGPVGRALGVGATVILVAVALGLLIALPASSYVDQICADGCVVAPGPNAVSTGPIMLAWTITGLANLVPIVVGIWLARRLNAWLNGESSPEPRSHASSDELASRVAAGPNRTQLKNVRLIRGMRTALFPWRH